MNLPTVDQLHARLATALTRLLAAAERIRWPLARRSTVDQLRENLTHAREALTVALQMDQDRRERALSLVEAAPITLPSGARPCGACGQPMPWGVTHRCVTEPVPDRRVA